MQAFEATSLRVLPASKSNHSTSNLSLHGKRDPPIELVQTAAAPIPFSQATVPTDAPTQVPYQAFLALVSFVASIVFSLGISAAQATATSSSFFGSNLSNGGALSDALFKASRVFAWAGALAAIGLMMSLALQLLLTSQMMMKGMFYHKGLKTMVASMAWLSVILVCGSIACVAEGVKVIDQKAGLAIQVLYILYPYYVVSNRVPPYSGRCWLLGLDRL